MLGAITGDIIGSVYEFDSLKPEYDFPLFTEESFFTDDTALTVALADSILFGIDYKTKLLEYYHLYLDCSYGGGFHIWANSDNPQPYNSFGNGSAMRVSPVGWAYKDLETVLQKAKESAEVTHNHPEGIKGAQATAASIYLAHTKKSKTEIKEFVEKTFNYNLDLDIEDLRKNYQFNESCQDTVPQAIFTFLVSDSFEDSIRKAIYIGGDSDTLAAINGSIAEAFYGGVPEEIKSEVFKRLDARIPFIESLLTNTKRKGDIIVYNKSFEITRLKEIARDFPDYTDDIEERIERIKDLMLPFQKRYYYKPEMMGSYSIKNVLPALVPDLSYDGMPVADGGMAMIAYESLLY